MRCNVVTSASVSRFAVCIIALLVGATTRAQAHEGHEHADIGMTPAQAAPTGASVIQGLPALRGTRLPDGSVFLPKPAQFKLGIGSITVGASQHESSLVLQGVIVPDPNHSAVVTSIEKGLVEAAPQGFPITGARVRQGQTLATIRPILESAERIKRTAALAQANQDRRANALSLRILLGQLHGQNPMTTTTVFQKNLETERQAIDTRIEEAHRILNGRSALKAPLAGEISLANARIGTLVAPGQTLFEIIDPSRLWVEVRSYDVLPMPIIGVATARTQSGSTLDLAFVGQGLQTLDQSLPLNFRITRMPKPIYVGQPVTVSIQARAADSGIVLARDCIGRAPDGDSQVWVQTAVEHFVSRDVETGSMLGERVLVKSGLANGERVVCQRAWLLDQVH
jgi:cobalt-zinc-cadmium efflux system membrane fusion protein